MSLKNDNYRLKNDNVLSQKFMKNYEELECRSTS